MIEHISPRTTPVIAPPLVEAAGVLPVQALEDEPARADVLSELLEQPDSARIAPYIPEEWLPSANQPRYREAYINAWWGCLAQMDYRADFVDGDIGEQDASDEPPQVIKAAHLAPILGKAGLITTADVAYIVGGTDSEVLRESFADTARAARAAYQPTLGNVPDLLRQVQRAASDPTITPARAAWLQESGTEVLAREVARGLDLQTAELLTAVDGSIETQIALCALARHGRMGVDIRPVVPWMAWQRQHDDSLVRRHATAALRHLHHAGVLPVGMVESAGIDWPQLAGELSRNLQYMPGEVLLAGAAAEQIMHDPLLARSFYPIVMVGGSRLKGYGDEMADTDMCVVARPGTAVNRDALKVLFGGESPKVLEATETPNGLHIDPFWSNFLYNSAWIGDSVAIAELRQAAATMYDDSLMDRFVALRRLEQDALQYRLLHKGYQRHYPVRADDELILADGIDSRSTFWDPGYRKLATRLFAEKVRLPKNYTRR